MPATKTSPPVYSIRIDFQDKNWIINRTYDEFTTMIAKLSETNFGIPTMPTKGSGFFSPSEDPELKKSQLSQVLFKLLENHQVMNNIDFLSFLGFDQNAPEYKPIEVQASSSLHHPSNSLQAMKLSRNNEDMFLLGNKEGTTFGNFKNFMGFNGNESAEVEVYKRLPGAAPTGGPTSLTLASSLELKSHASCLYWFENEKILVVGLENGSILVYTVELKITPVTFKELLNKKVHKKPVTGIAIDGNKKLLYSISQGRRLRTLSIESGEIVNGKLV